MRLLANSVEDTERHAKMLLSVKNGKIVDDNLTDSVLAVWYIFYVSTMRSYPPSV